MVKINLLPARVIEMRRVRSLAKLLILVVLVEVIVLSAGVYNLAQKEQEAARKYDNAHARAEQVRALEEKVSAVKRDAAPLKAKLDWYEAIYEHNAKIAESLEKINEYVFAELTVRQLRLSGDSVQLNAATKNIDYVTKAYFNLLRSTNIVPGTVQLGLGRGASAGGGGGRGGRGGGRGGGPRGRGAARGRGGGGAAASSSGGGGNSNEAMAVQFSFALLPQYSISSSGAKGGGGAARGGGGRGGGGRGGGGRGMAGRMGRGRR